MVLGIAETMYHHQNWEKKIDQMTVKEKKAEINENYFN